MKRVLLKKENVPNVAKNLVLDLVLSMEVGIIFFALNVLKKNIRMERVMSGLEIYGIVSLLVGTVIWLIISVINDKEVEKK
jgi:hypothetical protein